MLQSVQLPFAMLPVLHFTASRRRLGRFVSGRKWMALSVCLALLVIAINVTLATRTRTRTRTRSRSQSRTRTRSRSRTRSRTRSRKPKPSPNPKQVTLVIQFVEEFPPAAVACVSLYGCLYAFVCARMVWDDVKALAAWASSGRLCASDNLGTHLTERPSAAAESPATGSPATASPTASPAIVRVSAPVVPPGTSI